MQDLYPLQKEKKIKKQRKDLGPDYSITFDMDCWVRCMRGTGVNKYYLAICRIFLLVVLMFLSVAW